MSRRFHEDALDLVEERYEAAIDRLAAGAARVNADRAKRHQREIQRVRKEVLEDLGAMVESITSYGVRQRTMTSEGPHPVGDEYDVRFIAVRPPIDGMDEAGRAHVVAAVAKEVAEQIVAGAKFDKRTLDLVRGHLS